MAPVPVPAPAPATTKAPTPSQTFRFDRILPLLGTVQGRTTSRLVRLRPSTIMPLPAYTAETDRMQIVIGDVLPAEEVATVCAALERVRFVDGRETAGFAARLVKHNEQAAGD